MNVRTMAPPALALLAGASVLVAASSPPPKTPPAPATAPVRPPQPAPQPTPPPAEAQDMDHAPEEPGPLHARLAKLAGTYTWSSTFSMPGMDKMPPESGTATLRAVLGGRFLHAEETGTMMGQEFTSFKMYGYNSGAKKYEGVWTYTGSNAMMHLKGSTNDDGKSIRFDASVDEGAGGEGEAFQITLREIDADHFTVTLTARDQGGIDMASLETTYTRTGAAPLAPRDPITVPSRGPSTPGPSPAPPPGNPAAPATPKPAPPPPGR
ncbi:MAG TPA: DUF1579 family protein [Phycisphaerales bacterium]|nr:DUF1579 family protein [Phycisphaerales bacterium]